MTAVSGTEPPAPDQPAPDRAAADWLASFAARLGRPAPTEAEIEDLLALAGTAAHASERIAAPIACWMVGAAGLDTATARALAQEI